MLAIRLDEPIIEQIALLAKSKHMKKSEIIRQAIIQYLEDNEDLELAKLACSTQLLELCADLKKEYRAVIYKLIIEHNFQQ